MNNGDFDWTYAKTSHNIPNRTNTESTSSSSQGQGYIRSYARCPSPSMARTDIHAEAKFSPNLAQETFTIRKTDQNYASNSEPEYFKDLSRGPIESNDSNMTDTENDYNCPTNNETGSSYVTPELQELLKNPKNYALFEITPCKEIESAGHSKTIAWSTGTGTFVKMPCSTQDPLARKYWDEINFSLTHLASHYFEGNKPLFDLATDLKSTTQRYNGAAGNYNFENANVGGGNLELIGEIASQALKLPFVVPKPIPLLKTGMNKTILMTQQQVFCLLANAFFCTFPNRVVTKYYQDLPNYPRINFFELLHQVDSDPNSNPKVEKLKCILNYFSQMCRRDWPGSLISYERRCLSLSDLPQWYKSRVNLSKVIVNTKDPIEIGGKGMLQVDFANKLIGGGTLGNGSVMEEIRFSICPELILSGLFTEALGDLEVMVVKGFEQFSSYSGYGHTFTYSGSFNDDTQMNEYRQKDTEIVAMDALYFPQHKISEQYRRTNIDRELNKCYAGFKQNNYERDASKPVATGNWGCGVYNGDPDLKFLIQWMAASQAGRNIHMFIPGGEKQGKEIKVLVKYLHQNGSNVGQLYQIIMSYSKEKNTVYSHKSLFQFIWEMRKQKY